MSTSNETKESGLTNNVAVSSSTQDQHQHQPLVVSQSKKQLQMEQQSMQSQQQHQSQQQSQQQQVLRKYLCLAPRPDEWEMYCILLYKSKAINEKLIQKTLQQLYKKQPQFQCYYTKQKSNDNDTDDSKTLKNDTTTTTTTITTNTSGSSDTMKVQQQVQSQDEQSHDEQQQQQLGIPQLRRTGPGRKSNAEYAIQFYEYMLQQYQNDNSNDSSCRNIYTEVNEVKENDDRDKINEANEEEVDDDDEMGLIQVDSNESCIAINHPTNDKKEGNHLCEVCCSPCINNIHESNNINDTSTVIGISNVSTTPTDVIKCTTCPNIFHVNCVRPKLDEQQMNDIIDGNTSGNNNNNSEISDSNQQQQNNQSQQQQQLLKSIKYRCAYCILSTYKRNDKHRKQAAAAVRFMARLKKQFHTAASKSNHINNNSKPINDDNSLMKEVDNVAVASNNTSQKDTINEKLPTLNELSSTNIDTTEGAVAIPSLSTPTEAETKTTSNDNDNSNVVVESTTTTTTTSSTTTSSARSSPKRNRKQPTLYDPQDGPASRWQTDELKEWKLQRAKEEEEEDDDNEDDNDSENDNNNHRQQHDHIHNYSINNHRVSKRNSSNNNESSTVVCNFCHDDMNIPICVFCACRICFGKYYQNELLLCDNCDDEYHIFCLDPPLEHVPDLNEPWYCRNCTNSNNHNMSNNTGIVNGSVARPLRRTISKTNAQNSGYDESPSTRRSLRSPKLSTEAIMMLSTIKDSVYEKIIPSTENNNTGNSNKGSKKMITKPSIKRPRGRPPKIDTSSTGTTPMNSNSDHSVGSYTFSTSSMKSTTTTKRSNNNNTKDNPNTKRKLGRPFMKKTETTTIVESRKQKSDTSTLSNVRKRGRPPSAATLAKRARNDIPERKSKKQQLSITTSTKRNNDTSMTTTPTMTTPTSHVDTNSLESSTNMVPVTISRSGRTVRRSNFHDELDEGAQHLKSARYSNNNNSEQQYYSNKNPSPSPRTNNNNSVSFSESMQSQPSFATLSTTSAHLGSPNEPLQLEENIASVITNSTPIQASGPKSVGILSTTVLDQSQSTLQQQLASKQIGTTFTSHAGYGGNESMDHDTSSATAFGMGHNTDNTNDDTAEISGIMASDGVAHGQQQQQSHNMLDSSKQPRRKPGARECMQISRRFGVKEIPQQYMDILLDYCNRGKVEHLIRMRERLDEHSRFLEMQLAGLEALVLERGESDIVVPLAPPSPDRRHE